MIIICLDVFIDVKNVQTESIKILNMKKVITKAITQEIKDYCYMLFMMLDLDWSGYMSLKQLESEMIRKGEIIYPT